MSDLGEQLQAIEAARKIAAEQAEDEALWFVPVTAAEAYLQVALRRLTRAVEGEFWPEDMPR